MNSTSILKDIKSLLGIPDEVKDFDPALLMHCNSVFSGLVQMGLGEDSTFFITDDTIKWFDIFDDYQNLHNIKTYIYLKVKLLFDPPANATLVSSINAQIQECEWRIGLELENIKKGDV